MRKKGVFIGLGCLVAALLFFHRPLGTFITQELVEYSLARTLKTSVVYDKAYYADDAFVLESPRLGKGEFLTAEKLLVKWQFDWSARQLNLDLIIEKPQGSIEIGRLRWGRLSRLLALDEGWLKIKPSIQVKEGQITWCCRTKEQAVFLPLAFDLEWDGASGGLFKGRLDDLKKEIRVALTSDLESSKQIQIEGSGLAVAEMKFIQALLSSLWPAIKEVELIEGRLDVVANLEVSSKGITKAECRRLKATDFVADLKPWNAQWSCQELISHAEVTPTAADRWSTLNGTIDMHGGRLQSDQFPQGCAVEDIQTHLEIRSGEIQHTPITFDLAGLKGTLGMSWKNNKGMLTLNLDGYAENIASFLPLPAQKGIKKHFYGHPISLTADLSRKGGLPSIEGVIAISGKPPNQADFIQFGCTHTMSGWKGWFRAKDLPLESYLSPFIFPRNQLMVSGKGEFDGTFDNLMAKVRYDAENLAFENEDLHIDVKSLAYQSDKRLVGTHEFDLTTYSHRGRLPIANATYHEKNTGLDFTDIETVLLFEKDYVHCTNLEGFSNGIYFSGTIDLDSSDPAPGAFTVKMRIPTLYGRVAYIQEVLGRLDRTNLLDKVPLEGDVESRKNGLVADFDFRRGGYDVQATVSGAILNGTLPFQSVDVDIQGLTMDFDYDHTQRALQFHDIQGALFIGKAVKAEEYLLAGHRIALHGLHNQEIDVDLEVRDGQSSLMRFVATTQATGANRLKVLVDPLLSHMGQVRPSTFTLELNDWNEVDNFQLAGKFQLASFMQHLQRLGRAGLFSFPEKLQNKFLSLEQTSGHVEVDLGYRHSQDLWTYVITGDDLIWQDSHIQHALFQGKKQDKKWMIDQLQLDDIAMSAELEHVHDNWKLNFLGLRYRQALRMGLSGIFPDGRLDAKVNLFELSLDKLGYDLAKGKVHGTGNLEMEFLDNAPWCRFKGTLDARSEGVECRGAPLCDNKPFKINFHSDGGIASKAYEVELALGDGDYTFKNKTYNLDDVRLTMKPEQVALTAKSQFRRCPFTLVAAASWPKLDQGHCVLADNSSDDPLKVQWVDDPVEGMSIESIHGCFSGLTCSLHRDKAAEENNGWKQLTGDIAIELDDVCNILESPMEEQFRKLGIGPRYFSNGRWWVNLDQDPSFANCVYFQGKLEADDSNFKGYRISTLKAEVNYHPGRIEAQRLTMRDPAGLVFAPQITFLQEQGDWTLFIPKIIIKDLRPAFLHSTLPVPKKTHEEHRHRKTVSKAKNLILRRVEIDDFYGKVDNVQTWRANGTLHFLNPSRKNINHPIFAIPGEVILRLGLDPHVLNPVTGAITFNLTGDRFYLTKFKDIYSEGRGSKFTLAGGPTPSWIDLDGNLSVQIKMKHYNLLFKLSELFTVSIDGTIKKPTYTLKKQGKAASAAITTQEKLAETGE